MPFPFKSPTPHPNPSTRKPPRSSLLHYTTSAIEPYTPFISPWPPARPLSPTSQLRRSFRSFVSSENVARAQRNEVLFASPAARDAAFEKLMRLSRGEERIGWEIEGVGEGEGIEIEGGDGVAEGGEELEKEVEVGPKDGVEEVKEIEVEDVPMNDEAKKQVHPKKKDVEDVGPKELPAQLTKKDDDEMVVVDTSSPNEVHDPQANADETDDDWEDIEDWKNHIEEHVATSNSKGKEKADHERKDSKECAFTFKTDAETGVENVHVDPKKPSVTYIEDISKVGTST